VAVINRTEIFARSCRTRCTGNGKRLTALGNSQDDIHCLEIRYDLGLVARYPEAVKLPASVARCSARFNLAKPGLRLLGGLSAPASALTDALGMARCRATGRALCSVWVVSKPLVVAGHAHTPDALEKKPGGLGAPHVQGKLTCGLAAAVTGDTGKRRAHGRVAEQAARINWWVTDDKPPQRASASHSSSRFCRVSSSRQASALIANRAQAINMAASPRRRPVI